MENKKDHAFRPRPLHNPVSTHAQKWQKQNRQRIYSDKGRRIMQVHVHQAETYFPPTNLRVVGTSCHPPAEAAAL